MNRNFNLFTLLVGLSSANQAAVPPPEKLLPADTLGVITVPDYAKARAAYEANASSQLWRDPAMKPFTEKLMNKVREEFITPLERQLGVKFADYSGLAQGQFTQQPLDVELVGGKLAGQQVKQFGVGRRVVAVV